MTKYTHKSKVGSGRISNSKCVDNLSNYKKIVNMCTNYKKLFLKAFNYTFFTLF